ncbi:MAG: type I-C CRISPR-associated protein Cas8c/Csd1 [Deltaproteobacteria bacterium RIFOXYD12_FULL_57_12]|nr:MAG: type I-C CRISPR-associated protein Cas8c/Csd1 [Deltaproteobacteria bacterium RIFOXYD12_FULL_57_12]
MLNQLVEYARNNLADSEPGFTTRTVRWLVEVAADGRFVNIVPLGDDKKGEQTPKCPEMHNMVAGGRAHFLVETLQTVALLCKPNEEVGKVDSARKKQSFFSKMVRQAATETQLLQPLALFLGDGGQQDLLRERLTTEKAKPTDWLRWRVAGVDPLQQQPVLDWWRTWRETDLTGKNKVEEKPKRKRVVESTGDDASDGMICFLSGEKLLPVSTQPKVTGLSGVGGLGTGDVMAGFDKAAFCSFGLEQASNAAMGEKSVRGYVDGMNHLIKNYSRKLANVLVVHWFKEVVRVEDDPLAFLLEPPELTEAAAQNTAKQILESLRMGQRSVPGNNRYFAMTLSGASGRVMVRDWMEGSFEELVARIELWFSDLEIVARDGTRLAYDPKFMAVCGALVRDLKDFPAPSATTLWRVALAGLPIPQPLVAQALSRFRTDLIDDKPFNHARMGLIKAYFIRKGGNHNMTAYLNKEHPEPAYQCGRLLAMLAGLQRAALGDVGAGVVQRYYVAASQTPGLTLGRLVANAKNHLGKLKGGLAFWYEGEIAAIMSQIQDRIPATLDLEKQSLFALGYYQQIAANRAGKNNDTNETSKGDNQ